MTRILVLALALLLFAHVARGSDYSVNCPEKIFTIQSVASEIPGWESTQVSEPASAVPNNYSSVGFYSGHPSGNALLRADSERGEFTLSVSSEIWVECRYENTIVTITARLPAGLKKCKINRQVTGRRTVFVASCRNASLCVQADAGTGSSHKLASLPARLNTALDVGVETMRKKLSIATRDAVLKELNHLCAVCGGIGPQVHHVDEDNSNNVVENLLPLCPNCHLRDQHNPTRRHAAEKLQLFRKYKDPFILKAQFHPIFLRMKFMEEAVLKELSSDDIIGRLKELLAFIAEFQMGKFYAEELSLLMRMEGAPFIGVLGKDDDRSIEAREERFSRECRAHVSISRERAQELIVEMLRYQSWPNI